MAEMAARTRQLFSEGRSVCDGVRRPAAYELRLTWHGGARILERLERSDFDVFATGRRLAARDAGPLLWRAALWTAA